MENVITAEGARLAVRTWGPAQAPVVVLVRGPGLAVESRGRVPELLGHARGADAPDDDMLPLLCPEEAARHVARWAQSSAQDHEAVRS